MAEPIISFKDYGFQYLAQAALPSIISIWIFIRGRKC